MENLEQTTKLIIKTLSRGSFIKKAFVESLIDLFSEDEIRNITSSKEEVEIIDYLLGKAISSTFSLGLELNFTDDLYELAKRKTKALEKIEKVLTEKKVEKAAVDIIENVVFQKSICESLREQFKKIGIGFDGSRDAQDYENLVLFVMYNKNIFIKLQVEVLTDILNKMQAQGEILKSGTFRPVLDGLTSKQAKSKIICGLLDVDFDYAFDRSIRDQTLNIPELLEAIEKYQRFGVIVEEKTENNCNTVQGNSFLGRRQVELSHWFETGETPKWVQQRQKEEDLSANDNAKSEVGEKDNKEKIGVELKYDPLTNNNTIEIILQKLFDQNYSRIICSGLTERKDASLLKALTENKMVFSRLARKVDDFDDAFGNYQSCFVTLGMNDTDLKWLYHNDYHACKSSVERAQIVGELLGHGYVETIHRILTNESHKTGLQYSGSHSYDDNQTCYDYLYHQAKFNHKKDKTSIREFKELCDRFPCLFLKDPYGQHIKKDVSMDYE